MHSLKTRITRPLLPNVHPYDWTNPEPTPSYNLVVLGGGTAGLITAAGAAGLGVKVALVEREHLGVGCVLSKALLRAARAYADVRDAGQYDVEVPDGTRVNFPVVMERIAPAPLGNQFARLGTALL